MILATTVSAALVVAQIFCPTETIPEIHQCMDDHGYGNYQLMGPFDNQQGELVWIGYLDQDNQINIHSNQIPSDLNAPEGRY